MFTLMATCLWENGLNYLYRLLWLSGNCFSYFPYPTRRIISARVFHKFLDLRFTPLTFGRFCSFVKEKKPFGSMNCHVVYRGRVKLSHRLSFWRTGFWKFCHKTSVSTCHDKENQIHKTLAWVKRINRQIALLNIGGRRVCVCLWSVALSVLGSSDVTR